MPTFQNFENNNPEFLDMIKNKIVKLVCENYKWFDEW